MQREKNGKGGFVDIACWAAQSHSSKGPIMIGYVVREEADNLAINTAVQLQYGRHPDREKH
jgi:hypothetical protein